MFDKLVQAARGRGRRANRRTSRALAEESGRQRAAGEHDSPGSGAASRLAAEPAAGAARRRSGRRRTASVVRQLSSRRGAEPSAAEASLGSSAGRTRSSRGGAILLRSARPRRRRWRTSLTQLGVGSAVRGLRRRHPALRREARAGRESRGLEPGCPRILRFRRRLDPWRRFFGGSRLSKYVAILASERTGRARRNRRAAS